MMRRVYILTLLLAIMPAILTAADDGGTQSVFSLGAGARAMGMGNGFVGLADDATAIYYNPAGLESLSRQQVSMLHTILFEGTIFDYVSYVYPHSTVGSFGVAGMRIGTDDIGRRDNVTDLGTFTASQMQLMLAYSRPVHDRITAGITLKLGHHSIDNYSDYGFGVDLGARGRITERFYGGILLQDLIGPSYKLINTNERTPFNFKIGGAYLFSMNRLPLAGAVTFDLDKPESRSIKVRTGFEVTHVPYGLTARGGFDRDNVTLGLGIKYQDLTFDYAFKFIDGLTDSHRFSITFDFGKIRRPLLGAAALTDEDLARARRAASDTIRDEIKMRRDKLVEEADRYFRAGEYNTAYAAYWSAAVLTDLDDPIKDSIAAGMRNMRALVGSEVQPPPFVDSTEITRLQSQYQQADSLRRYYQVLADSLKKNRAVSEAANERQITIYGLLNAGLVHYIGGRNSSAQQAFDSVLTIDPGNQMAKRYKQMILDKANRPTTLDELQKDPVYWQYYLDGLEAFTNGEYERAIALWEKVLEKYPNSRNTIDNIEQARLRLQN